MGCYHDINLFEFRRCSCMVFANQVIVLVEINVNKNSNNAQLYSYKTAVQPRQIKGIPLRGRDQFEKIRR